MARRKEKEGCLTGCLTFILVAPVKFIGNFIVALIKAPEQSVKKSERERKKVHDRAWRNMYHR